MGFDPNELIRLAEEDGKAQARALKYGQDGAYFDEGRAKKHSAGIVGTIRKIIEGHQGDPAMPSQRDLDVAIHRGFSEGRS